MKPDFDTMTLDELRDWVADDAYPKWRTYTHGGNDRHPFPRTLDAADAAMPEGYTWCRIRRFNMTGGIEFTLHWLAYHSKHVREIWLDDTGNRVRDLFALVCKCRWAKREAQQ